jgi:hypothetical protein
MGYHGDPKGEEGLVLGFESVLREKGRASFFHCTIALNQQCNTLGYGSYAFGGWEVLESRVKSKRRDYFDL